MGVSGVNAETFGQNDGGVEPHPLRSWGVTRTLSPSESNLGGQVGEFFYSMDSYVFHSSSWMGVTQCTGN
jgi:hypothetical protein